MLGEAAWTGYDLHARAVDNCDFHVVAKWYCIYRFPFHKLKNAAIVPAAL